MSKIKDIKTCDLVAELERREGVEVRTAEPYSDIDITATGPAVVLIVKD